ncbi:phosphotransferase [Shimazuella sp. AN120528]|uniref:phosphotransferase enzyme family protein n=1 Tax=Shimazuella soli TaxID=1892854 RepID=UPI001F102309|nr:phosphotransferase [Shimazuella soli]MCH5586063.1 phosphotransferase [Shimazuella soli]
MISVDMETEIQLAKEVFNRYFMGSLTDIEILQGASPNRCWLIRSNSGLFVLRKCVRNRNREWLQYLERLTESLLVLGFPVAPLIESRQRDQTVYYADDYWQLRPYIEGRFYQLGRNEDIFEALATLLNLHQIDKFPNGPTNPNIGVERWIESPEQGLKETEIALFRCANRKHVEKLIKLFSATLEDALMTLSSDRFQSLPFVLTHGDFHGTNLIFNQNKLISVLDWDTVEIRPRIYDIALAAFLLTRKRRGSFEINPSYTKKFLEIYSTHSRLTREEWSVIVPLLQLHYIPTKRYLDLMRIYAPNLLNWYLKWSVDAIISIKHQLNPVINQLK